MRATRPSVILYDAAGVQMDLYPVTNLYGAMKNASQRVRTVVPQRVIDDNESGRLSMHL